MATGITTYQCPACTGPLHFVGESGKLECDYCGKAYEVAEIEKLFSENEKDEEMSVLIPDSRWARVRTGDGWYVVGIVGEPAEFICYGIPGDDPSDPPEEDEGCRQWVEVEKGGRGYWMMYQSAESGETLRAV